MEHAIETVIKEYKAALKPFADVAKFLDSQPASLLVMCDDDMVQVQMKHYRKAAKVLKKK